jgi:hypothetical protein
MQITEIIVVTGAISLLTFSPSILGLETDLSLETFTKQKNDIVNTVQTAEKTRIETVENLHKCLTLGGCE